MRSDPPLGKCYRSHIHPAQGRQLSYRDPLVEALLKDAEPAVAAFASLEIEPAEITHPPKSLRFFADWAAKKWPLRGSLKGPAGDL